ncbi:MAG TPA: hypothetical protein VFP78_08265 [Solirubrobacteraceae bacterium]|nr:hypothetical protein [Solirubrobacteraceae bacterium]
MTLIRTLAVALAFAAVAVPTAQAKFVDIHQPLIEQSMPACPLNFSRNPVTKECRSPFETVKVPTSSAPAPSAPAAEPSSGGIDWEDAGLGAGGALAMVLLAGGGAIAVAHRKRGLRTAA